MWILVEVVHPLGVEQGGTSFQAMDNVSLFEQEIAQIGTVLAGDPGNKCYFFHNLSRSRFQLFFNFFIFVQKLGRTIFPFLGIPANLVTSKGRSTRATDSI